MESVLVTGGAGYIGSHACKQLARHGFRPVAYDNLSLGHRWAVRWGPLVEGELADRERLEAACREHGVVAVMHFAALASVGESVAHPERYFRNNVAGTLSLLEAMLAAGVRCQVFSSTAATFGIPEAPLITEDHPQRPINPYGASKLMVERMLQDFAVAHGLRSVALRYFNAAGADPEGETGEVHEPETHLVPLALEAAVGRRQLTVFGTDYPTPDGTAIRDYIHVEDLAEAHLRALEGAAPGEHRIFNLGHGSGISVRQVIETAREVTGVDIPVHEAPRRPGDPPELVAACEKICAELGWAPHKDLEAIVEDAWTWHQAHPSGYSDLESGAVSPS
jgi:UDP-arabinose 4-epimerase